VRPPTASLPFSVFIPFFSLSSLRLPCLFFSSITLASILSLPSPGFFPSLPVSLCLFLLTSDEASELSASGRTRVGSFERGAVTTDTDERELIAEPADDAGFAVSAEEDTAAEGEEVEAA
jgi:hypothetical protein